MKKVRFFKIRLFWATLRRHKHSWLAKHVWGPAVQEGFRQGLESVSKEDLENATRMIKDLGIKP